MARSPESRAKQRATIISRLSPRPVKEIIISDVTCIQCNSTFRSNKHHQRNKYICSSSCYSLFVSKIAKTRKPRLPNTTYRGKPINADALHNYRILAKFRFDPLNEPDTVEFSSFKQFGAWHPFNNKDGLVRDHMFSIKAGFTLDIDPAIIRHPANCAWLDCATNSSKNDGCSITLQQLMDRIEIWNSSYMLSPICVSEWSPRKRNKNGNKPKVYPVVSITKNGEIKQIKSNNVPAYRKIGWERCE